ncbi:hypothetical protein HZY88_08215 [Aerococcaceae bacterium DSM 111176]|nr:hypothetical protein [Aerococcaceae bacterium DSM 111176]
MTEQNNNFSKQIEEEIQKQLGEVDRRIDRGGWPSLLIIILALFAGLYLITYWLNPDDGDNVNVTYEERAASYESKLEELENRIEELEQAE